jgi:hypothetical protein
LQLQRVKYQDSLSAEKYHNAMLDRIDEVHESRLEALREVGKEKVKVERAYNKKIVENRFKWMIWFGKRFCQWDLEVTGLVSGLQVGRDRLRLLEWCHGIHTL